MAGSFLRPVVCSFPDIDRYLTARQTDRQTDRQTRRTDRQKLIYVPLHLKFEGLPLESLFQYRCKLNSVGYRGQASS